MKCWKVVWLVSVILSWAQVSWAGPGKLRLLVVESYHREYLWSQASQRGFCAAMLKFGYLDNQAQVGSFAANDQVESSRAITQRLWMDTKRYSSRSQMAEAAIKATRAIGEFHPDLIFLSGDNATNYIGNQFLDTEIPVIFWGVAGWPMKYGLLDSIQEPGHNVTGIWQSGYSRESLGFLHQLVPHAKTFAILACDSDATRAKVKEIEALDREHGLSMRLVDVVTTNSYPEFKHRALELAEQVDAFFVLNHDTLKDENDVHVDMLTVGRWYLEHIHKPETSDERQFVDEGMLCAADDSGFNQAFEAVTMAVEILEHHVSPGRLPPRTPQRGPLLVNRQRAEMLGVALEPWMETIEELIERSVALQATVEGPGR